MNAKELAKRDEQEAALVLAMMDEDEGVGVSTDPEDNLVPLIYILQAQSPQCNKRSPEHIDGAEAGSIWLRNSIPPIVNGEEGILFQPCFASRDYVEWVPRDAGGGFVGRHDKLPDDAKQISDPKNPSKVKWIRPGGTELVDTRYVVGNVWRDGNPQPFVIPLTSSGHTFFKQWTVTQNAMRAPNGKKPAIYGVIYRLTTEQRTNASGTWFGWKQEPDHVCNTVAEMEAGRAMNRAFAAGHKAVENEHVVIDPKDDDIPF